MFPRILVSAAGISGLLLGMQLTLWTAAYGQIRYETSTVVPKTDPIYPVLAAQKAFLLLGKQVGLFGRTEDPEGVNILEAPSPRLLLRNRGGRI